MKRFVGLFFGFWVVVGTSGADSQAPLERIAFGSCYKPEKKGGVWAGVRKFDPQLWIWLGDNFYHDWANGKYVRTNDDPDSFEKGYRALGRSEGVQALQSLAADRVMATWDDHDFGKNDAGKEYDRKEESRKAFAKFFGVPDRPDGIYSSRDFGPEGKRVRVILLDTRYNRDSLPRKGEAPSDGDILGESQWSWLGEELARTGANLIILGSSIQFVSEQHRFEKWANFPKAKDRLLRLLPRAQTQRVILLSGDRHHAEISCLPEGPVGYPLYDITSSGITEGGGVGKEENRYRVADLWNANNFGAIQIDWSQANPTVSLEIRDEKGNEVRQVSFPFTQLALPKQ
ncbi:MAG: alkaline phosphatase D family protein [Verrucomicrobia bacterium]|nr:alkaline phosphatase D family protein [Verrucomicrobiota bacterium]MDA1339709.1 alkaline phosphatase D family protein [Verrucomicrobiota bacterium]